MESPLSRVSFERSGGLFHQVLGGEVLFADGRAVRTAAGVDPRALDAREVALFRKLDWSALRRAAAARTALHGEPDRYQYDVVLSLADGERIPVRFYEGEPAQTLDAEAPGLGGLADWVRGEVEAVWAARAARVRP